MALPLAWPLIGKLAAGGTAATIGTAIGLRNRGPDKKSRQKARSRVNDRELRNIEKFETLGVDFDPEEAKKDPKYINNVYNQIHARLEAAGVDVDNLGTRKTKDGKETKRSKNNLDDLVEAYNGLSDEAKAAYDKGPGRTGQPTDGTKGDQQTTGPANGTRQVKPAGGQQAGGSPLRPKAGKPQPSTVSAGSTSRYGTKADDSGIYVNGAPVSRNDDATLYNVKDAQRETTQTESIRARREREREQADAKSDTRRNYQKYANDQFDLDRSMDDLKERKRAYREEQEQRRKDRRFQNRDLSNADDWNNLGREGSNRRSYEAAANETAEQRKDREAAVEARNKQIAALRDRFAQMSDKTLLKEGEKYEWKNGRAVVTREGEVPVTDADGNVVLTPEGEPLTEKGRVEVSADELAQRKDSGVGQSEYSYGNKFYANDPNRQKELAALGRLVNAAAEGNTISDAQIEAATKKLDSWQAEADERGARVQSYQNMRNAEQVSNLRRQYGLTDKQAISDKDVMDYHKNQQKAARTEILKGMQVAPGAGPDAQAQGKSAMTKFSGQWQKLLDSGFDPQAMFAKAMQNADNKKAYMEGMASISSSDPDAADKRDQLRRRFIMNQAMEEHGIKQTGGESGQAGAQMAAGTLAQNLPGRKVLFNSRGEAEANQARMESLGGPQSMSPGDVQGALRPKRAGGPDGVTIVHSAQEARDAAKAINQSIDQQTAANRSSAINEALSDANNPNKAEYDALVAKNRTSAAQAAAPAAQAAAPVKQTAAPPVPEVPVIPRKKKTDEAQAAARGGVSALRPRRRG